MTGPFVLDASMTLSWAFETESTPLTVAVLKSLETLETVHALAPALWAFEVVSVLSAAERRGQIDAAAQTVFLERLRLLPVAIEHRPAAWLAQQILPLARTYHLTAYDAAYLDLAIRERLPLATLDDNLRRAASIAAWGLWALGELGPPRTEAPCRWCNSSGGGDVKAAPSAGVDGTGRGEILGKTLAETACATC